MREPVDCLTKSVRKSVRKSLRQPIRECIGKSIGFKSVRLAQPLTDVDGPTDLEPASTGHGLEHVIRKPIPKPVPLLEQPAIDESVPFGEPFRVPLVEP